MRTSKRRRLVRGLVALFVLLLSVDLAMLAAEKGVTEDASDSVVYERTSGIRFDHARHASTPCSTCHASSVTSKRAADDLMPSMQVCVDCHQDAEPKINRCNGCHVAYPVEVSKPIETAEDWRSVRPAPMPMIDRDTRIRFDHAGHVARHVASGASTDASCTSCHTMSGGKVSMPSMQSCQTCHDGKTADAQCTTCHVGDAVKGVRVKTRFGKEASGKVMLKPDNHDVDWMKRHGAIAKSNAVECASCHREEECATCHTERVAQPWKMHPPNYLTIHSVDARNGMGECTDCHTVDNFCASCHVRSGVSTAPGGSPPARLEFHPPGWLDSSMPNNHGVMSRRNINECASCHVEDDCVACHTGINPHAPEFALNCSQWLNANPRPCAKCHTDLASLRILCR